MRTYELGHLSDSEVLEGLELRSRRDKTNTAEYVAHIAEVEARRLYAPAGFPSMFKYCVGKLRLSEQGALRRIRAGRTARKYPVILDALADGRLHLTAVVLLNAHLRPDNAAELLGASEHKSQAEIELLLAQRFPKSDLPTRVVALAHAEASVPAPEATNDLLPAPTRQLAAPTPESTASELSGRTPDSAPSQLSAPTVEPSRSRIKPLAPERFGLQTTIDRETNDLLRELQDLLSHRFPSGEVGEVLKYALRTAVGQLRKHKFAKTDSPRALKGSGTDVRRIPAHVRRAVSERDQDRCTFVADSGRRCDVRKFLEFDHIDPVARGGRSTVENLRLRCRTHNQLEAERAFGAGFMARKRERMNTPSPLSASGTDLSH